MDTIKDIINELKLTGVVAVLIISFFMIAEVIFGKVGVGVGSVAVWMCVFYVFVNKEIVKKTVDSRTM